LPPFTPFLLEGSYYPYPRRANLRGRDKQPEDSS
jgi:hypothetical protein